MGDKSERGKGGRERYREGEIEEESRGDGEVKKSEGVSRRMRGRFELLESD